MKETYSLRGDLEYPTHAKKKPIYFATRARSHELRMNTGMKMGTCLNERAEKYKILVNLSNGDIIA